MLSCLIVVGFTLKSQSEQPLDVCFKLLHESIDLLFQQLTRQMLL